MSGVDKRGKKNYNYEEVGSCGADEYTIMFLEFMITITTISVVMTLIF